MCRFSRLILLVFMLTASLSSFAFGQATPLKAVASDDKSKVLVGQKVILDSERDGFMSVHRIVYSPAGKHFVVIGCGFECTDNIGFLFAADGTRKRDFTGRWDQIFTDKLEWSSDSKTFYYYRINSTGADPPRNAPAEGWIAVDVATGRKSSGIARRLERNKPYAVFDTADGLAVRTTPGTNGRELGRLASDAKDVYVTGPSKRIGSSVWVPVKSNALSGWVNQRFLFAAQK
jgi:hypothetical protein